MPLLRHLRLVLRSLPLLRHRWLILGSILPLLEILTLLPLIRLKLPRLLSLVLPLSCLACSLRASLRLSLRRILHLPLLLHPSLLSRLPLLGLTPLLGCLSLHCSL